MPATRDIHQNRIVEQQAEGICLFDCSTGWVKLERVQIASGDR